MNAKLLFCRYFIYIWVCGQNVEGKCPQSNDKFIHTYIDLYTFKCIFIIFYLILQQRQRCHLWHFCKWSNRIQSQKLLPYESADFRIFALEKTINQIFTDPSFSICHSLAFFSSHEQVLEYVCILTESMDPDTHKLSGISTHCEWYDDHPSYWRTCFVQTFMAKGSATTNVLPNFPNSQTLLSGCADFILLINLKTYILINI